MSSRFLCCAIVFALLLLLPSEAAVLSRLGQFEPPASSGDAEIPQEEMRESYRHTGADSNCSPLPNIGQECT